MGGAGVCDMPEFVNRHTGGRRTRCTCTVRRADARSFLQARTRPKRRQHRGEIAIEFNWTPGCTCKHQLAHCQVCPAQDSFYAAFAAFTVCPTLDFAAPSARRRACRNEVECVQIWCFLSCATGSRILGIRAEERRTYDL